MIADTAAAVAARPVFDPGSLTDLAGAPDLFDRYPMYQPALHWLRSFVAQPHPQLGRSGHVCPRLAPALKQNLIWLVALRTECPTATEASEKGWHLADLFEALCPEKEAFRSGTVLGFFPDVDAAGAGAFIDGGHQLLRMAFVKRGLMIGEFHPSSTVVSVHNPQFPVMRCPVPMFAVRAMSRHDVLFLDRAAPTPETGIYLANYLRHIGEALTTSERTRILARILATSETPTHGASPSAGRPPTSSPDGSTAQ